MPWYDRAFGPWYLKLYPHRDRREAARAVEALLRWLPSGPALDVACGAGRHLEALLDRGVASFGIDRSSALLAEAPPRLRSSLVRGDMRRLPFASGVFASVLSMFTSFGYFGTREAHVTLLAELARVTRPGGRLVLDYLNAPQVLENLVPESTRELNGFRIVERRHIDRGGAESKVVKEIVILSATGTPVEDYREEVTLYERDEMMALLLHGGWRSLATWGDYGGDAWSSRSPRLVMLAERAAR